MNPLEAAPSAKTADKAARLCIAAALVIGAHSGCVGVPDYDQRGGRDIAGRVAALDEVWITDVTYRPGSALDPAVIEIDVNTMATIDDIERFSCGVLHRILEAGDPPESLGIDFERGMVHVATYSDFNCRAPAESR